MAPFGRHTSQKRHIRLATLPLLLFLVLAAAGCSFGDDTTQTTIQGLEPGEVAGDADPEDVKVIQGWVRALDRGDLDAAAHYFAIPSVAENGPILVRIRSADDAKRFNATLPCGARLIRAESAGDFTTATFRLTERPGAGLCGPGTGGRAETTFVIRDGKIAEWRRVDTGGGGEQAPGRAI